MQIGMIGLGRMGADMVRRLSRAGHDSVVYDMRTASVQSLVGDRIIGSTTLPDFVAKLATPRVVWSMVPAAAVDHALADLIPLLTAGDIVIDGGNSYYRDDIRHAAELRPRGIHYVDVGTSGGIAGLERGYCLMIGGDDGAFRNLAPLLAALAPGPDATATAIPVATTANTAAQGYLHVGPAGAGHFVKMIHNGIEYGVMAAYAEGLNILRHANIGAQSASLDAETAQLRKPQFYRFELNLPQIAEL